MPILSKERYPIVRPETEPFPQEEIPLGEEGVIKKEEKEGAELERPVTDRGQVLVEPAQKPVKITLPVTAQAFANPANWAKPVTFAIRWLLEFVKRQIKKYPGLTQFRT